MYYNDKNSNFITIEDIKIDAFEKCENFNVTLEAEPYFMSEQLEEAVEIAKILKRPLLLQGEPGTGKTCLAHYLAFRDKCPLEEYYVKSTSRAQDLLYQYDAINRIYDAQMGTSGPYDNEKKPLSKEPRNYISWGPLGKAIIRANNRQTSIVLIDEIDKSDTDFPNDLLLELDKMKFYVNEVPNLHFEVKKENKKYLPLVIITHNYERPLSAAFLRRCVFCYVQFPTVEQLHEILKLHGHEKTDLNERAIKILMCLRKEMSTGKLPALSELIDWVKFLNIKFVDFAKMPIDKLSDIPGLGILLKNHNDQQNLGMINLNNEA